jgi:hypothetical protein
MNQTYLKTFFNEKNISYQMFEIPGANGNIHLIDTDYIQEAILSTSSTEQLIIANTLRKLDFCHNDINPYLKFLAGAIVKKFDCPVINHE